MDDWRTGGLEDWQLCIGGPSVLVYLIGYEKHDKEFRKKAEEENKIQKVNRLDKTNYLFYLFATVFINALLSRT